MAHDRLAFSWPACTGCLPLSESIEISSLHQLAGLKRPRISRTFPATVGTTSIRNALEPCIQEARRVNPRPRRQRLAQNHLPQKGTIPTCYTPTCYAHTHMLHIYICSEGERRASGPPTLGPQGAAVQLGGCIACRVYPTRGCIACRGRQLALCVCSQRGGSDGYSRADAALTPQGK